ncbi:E3 ubiquitin-protein ligase SIS3-like [Rutidosis leptorrhynchoides]|uniref:E3 ubiquitin-protein ligase SIS3-like n=1 Tax=Rutidosis leptorrhynchoides TaxID=125765 RepID=UPI003A999BEB
MAIRNTGFKWYDGFFLMMIAFGIIMIGWSWRRYDKCRLPIHMWLVVDYAVIFIFRLLMFLDNAIVATIGLENGWQLSGKRLFERVVLLCITYAVLYPFIWVWTVLGVVWFASGWDCLPEKDQLWGFVTWLLFSFGGLICVAGNFVNKWLIRRRAHLRRTPRGTRVSEFKVLLNLIRQPTNLVYEAAVRESRFEQQATVYNPRTEMCRSVLALVDSFIQRLPIFFLRDIPTDCSDCPICLEEFSVGDMVRGLPCAHSFHLACIDKWLKVNLRCPRCRCLVFPILRPNTASAGPVGPDQSTVPTTQLVITQPCSMSYFMRMQSFFMPVRPDNLPEVDPSSSATRTSTSSNTDAPPCESTPSPSQSASPTSVSTNGQEIVEIVGESSVPVK